MATSEQRMFGAELPIDVFDWVIGEVAPMQRSFLDDLNARAKAGQR